MREIFEAELKQLGNDLVTMSEQVETAIWDARAGADALAQIMTWRDGDRCFDLAHFIGVTRPGYELDGQELFNRREEFVGARFHGHATRGYARLIALLLDTVHKRESEQLSEREQQWAQSLRETSERPAGPGGLHL